MTIIPISHRGFWTAPHEKNSEAAFRRSLQQGFGIETDLRDRLGEIVIAHDMAGPDNMSLDRFLQIYREYPGDAVLALNIKADGLQDAVAAALRKHGVTNYFVFDMSVPDTLGYARRGIDYYTRVSEIEPVPSLYETSCGVWIDQFHSDWIDADAVLPHLRAGKKVCIVSPELHGRTHEAAWARYRGLEGLVSSNGMLFICTDFPDRAAQFFGP
jgi:hypothetical protein